LKLTAEIRGAFFCVSMFCAGFALLMACAVPARAARQDSNSDAAAKKPATAAVSKSKSSTAKSSTAKSSSGASSSTKSTSKTHTASTARTTGKRSSRKKSTRVRGQQKIDSERAQAIQQALIREHYLSGEPAGSWNQASEEAMRRYQADHGWQSKQVPDSRALIKLGLGPSKDHLLNPESAMTTVPDAPRAQAASPTSHTAAPEAHTTTSPTSAADHQLGDPPAPVAPDQNASHPQ
jgi:hypothetical protein